jgi:hypothetical protein
VCHQQKPLLKKILKNFYLRMQLSAPIFPYIFVLFTKLSYRNGGILLKRFFSSYSPAAGGIKCYLFF